MPLPQGTLNDRSTGSQRALPQQLTVRQAIIFEVPLRCPGGIFWTFRRTRRSFTEALSRYIFGCGDERDNATQIQQTEERERLEFRGRWDESNAALSSVLLCTRFTA